MQLYINELASTSNLLVTEGKYVNNINGKTWSALFGNFLTLTISPQQQKQKTKSPCFQTTEENLYECVQAPGHLGSPPDGSAVLRGVRHPNIRPDRRSEGSVPDGGQDYIKFRFLRSVSMPYCASEAESDIYSPYSFCGSEMVGTFCVYGYCM